MSDAHAPYALGSEPPELQRLDRQAQSIALPTAGLLQATGIGPGMRVLDLGTGLGHVSLLLAGLVGPSGEVVGVDRDERMLEAAEARRAAAGAANVRYLQGDVRSYRDAEPFDAVVERLVLFHLPDAVDVVRHHVGNLRPGGIFAAIEFDVGAARTEPADGADVEPGAAGCSPGSGRCTPTRRSGRGSRSCWPRPASPG